MRLNRTQEYLELTVYLMDDNGISPCQCDDFDEYEDLVFDAAEKAFGSPNASQKSVLRKWLRDDWAQYQYMAEIDRDSCGADAENDPEETLTEAEGDVLWAQ